MSERKRIKQGWCRIHKNTETGQAETDYSKVYMDKGSTKFPEGNAELVNYTMVDGKHYTLRKPCLLITAKEVREQRKQEALAKLTKEDREVLGV